jgi:3',5'-cyclic AMP phosphodiesterase CpdA
MTETRFVHVSDIHLTVPITSWRWEDTLNKRLFAWMNLHFAFRKWRFRHCEVVLQALARDLQASPAHIIFSGDATAMGFGEEMARAAELLNVSTMPGTATPGNHDYCTITAKREGHFENYFARWMEGERVGPEIYPFAQRVGGAWLVTACSAEANFWPWDATGTVGDEQLARLEKLLSRLEGGPRILVTHYPVVSRWGWSEFFLRRLIDLDGLLRVAVKGGIGLWLHGHIHHPFYFEAGKHAPFPIICAGSATQTGYWTYGDYTLRGNTLSAKWRVYDEPSGGFRDGEAFVLQLPTTECA